MTWRRYITPEGLRITTWELPAKALSHMGASKLSGALAMAARDLERQTRNARAIKLLDQGWKATAVAHEVGLSDSMVRRIRSRSNDGK